jgi:hypothetical protein
MVAIKRTLQEGNQKVKKKVIPFYFIPLTPYVYNHFLRLHENESAPRNKANAIDARAPRGTARRPRLAAKSTVGQPLKPVPTWHKALFGAKSPEHSRHEEPLRASPFVLLFAGFSQCLDRSLCILVGVGIDTGIDNDL